MQEQLINSIIALINAGGKQAIWILAIWFGSGVLKMLFGMGVIAFFIVRITNTINRAIDFEHMEKKWKIEKKNN